MTADVLVVGAGPVGLLLALRLSALGIRVRVLERLSERRPGSRSIGIHPPSLELLDALGLGEQFVERGIRVRRGLAFAGKKLLGRVDFARCTGPHRYVLTIGQQETESILRAALVKRAPAALQEGESVIGLSRGAGSMQARLSDDQNRITTVEASFVVACDGRYSTCRDAAAIPFRGERYAGAYLMGDAPDTTGLGDDAAVFLGRDGLVESFPLPSGMRRWVVRRPRVGAASAEELVDIVHSRTGKEIQGNEITELSAFHAECFVAERLSAGRLILAGDAAHVVSPIGGQGMNLGWLGAWSLATALARALESGRMDTIAADARHRRRIARTAARRAELNMWLGSPIGRGLRDPIVRALMRRPLADGLARVFTMRGLAWGV